MLARRTPDHRPGAVADRRARPQEDSTGRRRAIRCRACRGAVTTTEARIAIQGRHEHANANPHGIAFRFGCFSSAPGCTPVGAPSSEFSWFPGHSWQIEICARCRAHLGWLFRGAHRFHGLVLAKLVVDDE